MSGYPPYGVPNIHYVPQNYYAAGFMQQTMQPAVNVQTYPTAPQQVWVEHTSHDGRKYYYNSLTKVTTWEKPEELKTAAEKLVSSCLWKEFKSESGKVYYYNSQTKQSVWTKPPELIECESKAMSAADIANTVSSISVPPFGTPMTPATPGDDQKPIEPSAMEIAMKATLASMVTNKPSNAVDAAMLSSQIPLPPKAEDQRVSEERKVTDNKSFDEDDYNENTSSGASSVTAASSGLPEYKTRAEQAEGLRNLFREKQVPGNATWEHALKLIGNDPRYNILKNFVEKKQVFNVYKIQRQKEEREEQRMQAKQAKEILEKFLLKTKLIHSAMSYKKVDQVLADSVEWTNVPDYDRRTLLSDAMHEIAKREKEDAKALRKRNIKVFNEILNSMPKLIYSTTWSEAQQMLLDDARFTSDRELQSLDKEDALICFEEHIRTLERERDEEKEREKRKQKRAHRKNREAFVVLLDELREHQLLTSTSLWKDLYALINRDERFQPMLTQRGSTPLDLFKFYVETLKARFPMEKKLIKELLKEKSIMVELSWNFDNFKELVLADERGKNFDLGNIRLTFNSLLEKAQGRERERQREDARRLRKQEQAFCDMLRLAVDPPIRTDTSWDAVCARFSSHPSFIAITLESERIRVFKEYLIDLNSVDTGAGIYTADYDQKHSKSRRSKPQKARSTSREVDSHSEMDAQVDITTRKSHSKRSHRLIASKSGSDSPSIVAKPFDTDELVSNPSKKKHKKSKSKSKKSKKSKNREEKNQTSRSSRPSVTGGGELEEGEAADDDFEDEADRNVDEGDNEEGEITCRSKKHKHRKRQTSTREDGEADSLSEEDAFERPSSGGGSRRKHRS